MGPRRVLPEDFHAFYYGSRRVNGLANDLPGLEAVRATLRVSLRAPGSAGACGGPRRVLRVDSHCILGRGVLAECLGHAG